MEIAYLVAIGFLAVLLALAIHGHAKAMADHNRERQEWQARETKLLEQLTGVSLTSRPPSPLRSFDDRAEWEIEQERLGRQAGTG